MNKFISIFILSIFIISSVSAQTDGYQAGGLSNGSVYIKNTNNKPMNFFTADTQRMTLDSTGKLGIGTSNPSYMLELKSSGPMRPAILLNNTSTSNNNNFILFKGPNSQFNLYQWSAGQLLNISSDLNVETNIMRLWRDSSAVTIPNGNLGVGTDGQTNLTNRLHVVAPANPVRFVGLVSGAASDSVLTTDASGVIRRRSAGSYTSNEWHVTGNAGTNVATNFLGTTDNTDLRMKRNNEYAGEIALNNTSFGLFAGNISNSSGINNTSIGTSALDSCISASYNTAIGMNALRRNKSGDQNTAVGDNALANNSAAYNTAVGRAALLLNTTGSSNTGIGMGALQSNSTASQNTALGALSLTNNTTGGANTAIGYSAMQINTIGYQNVAVGVNTMYSSKSSIFNTAIGNNAMYNDTSGNSNVAVGSNAMYSNKSGYFNTAVGTSALYSITTGTSNEAFGLNALNDLTIGYRNTAIGFGAMGNAISNTYCVALGYQAGLKNKSGVNNVSIGGGAMLNDTSGNNNIGIGYNVGNSFLTGSNNIFIGTGVNPNVANNGSNQLNIGNWIYGDNSKIGIGNIPIPTNQLHVKATTNPLRLEGLQVGAATDSILTADINGVVRRRSPLSIAASSEPWFNQATKTGATLNTQNIYQLGNVMIGDTFSGAYYSSALGVKMPPSNGSNAGVVFRTTGTVKNPGLFMHADTTSGSFIMDFSGTTGYSGLFRVGGSNLVSLTNNLNVGIGTITPTAKLTVQGAYLSRQALFGYDAANGNGLSIRADGTNTHFNWQIDQQGVTSGLNFVPSTVAGGTTFSTPTMTLLETGNVGIGYVSPTNKLHVRATANPVKLEGLQVGAASDSIITADVAGVLRKRSASDVAASSEPWFNQATGTGATANTQNIYQMGNIGIGTNNPTRKLHVVGDVLVAPTASTGVVYIGNGLSGGNRTWMTKGIQVSSTSDNLYVGLKDEGSNNEDAVIAWGDDGGDDLRFINVISGGDTNGIEAMRIVGVSNFVGVNTIAPTNRLHVFSTSNPLRLEGLQSGVSSDSILTVDGTGVVRRRTASSVASSIEPWFNKLTGTGATSNSDSVYIMGKVGIATNTPITQLQIGANHGNNGGYLQINLDNTAPVEQTQGVKTSVIRTTGFNWGVNGTAWGVGATRNTGLYGYAAGATENWGLHVDTGLSIIDNRMGIGTSTPFSMLHVTDKIISGTNAATNGTSIIEGRYSQTSSSDDALNIFGSMYSSGGTMLSYGARAASFLSTDSFTSSTAVPLNRDALILDNLGYRFFTGANQTTAIGNGLSMSEKMRLTSAGFLGIGTTSPTDKLNVKSLTGAQHGITFEEDTINFRIYRDLDVPAWTNFRSYGGLGMAVIGQPDVPALTVSRHTGNVGVNTTSATNSLDVNGTARVRTLASGAVSDSIVTADANGVLRKRTLSSIVSASGGWSLLGNAGTSAATNFIGTTDNTDLIIKRNNQAAFTISSSEIYTGAFYLRAIGLGNYSSDIGDGTIQTHGINSIRFALGTGSNGYLGALTNNNSSGAGSVLLLKTNTTSAASKILNVLTNSATPLGAGSTVLVAQGDSKVGIATGSPNSTAHINGSFSTAISLKTAAYTATEADHILICNGTFTLTLPTAVGIAGREYIIKNTGTGTVTIDANGTQTIDGAATIPLSVQWTVRTIVSDGANWLIINNQ